MIMKNQNNRVDIKVVIIGDQSVGKTSLLKRFVDQKFEERTFQTIGAAFAAKEVVTNGKKRIIGIWDTAGTERYRSMAKMFYREAKAAIVCYDITDKNSWDGLRNWIAELRNQEEHCKIYICGTKKDLVDEGLAERDLSSERAMEYAVGIQVTMIETSSKTGENVAELFQAIVDDHFKEHTVSETNGTIQLANSANRRSCCYIM